MADTLVQGASWKSRLSEANLAGARHVENVCDAIRQGSFDLSLESKLVDARLYRQRSLTTGRLSG